MTMPHERTRALIAAVEFLRELRYHADTPPGMRDQLIGILRHLPEPRAIALEAERQLRQQLESKKLSWLLPADYYERSIGA